MSDGAHGSGTETESTVVRLALSQAAESLQEEGGLADLADER